MYTDMCPPHTEVESIFMPWLMREAEKVLDEKILARTLLDGQSIIITALASIAYYIIHFSLL